MAVKAAWYVEHVRISWEPVSGPHPLPLGRNVRHDSRNRAYPWQRSAAAPVSQMWTRHIPILDQGNVGSCTGNAEVGALGTDPDFGALPPSPPLLDENLALKIYSAAETIDGNGAYPPVDDGSSGPSAAQAAKDLGLISGYLHCLSLADVLDALQRHPVCVGANWYDSFDSPDGSGLVAISPGAQVRGGHEFLCRGLDVDAQLLFFDNSWGTGWGSKGSFSMSYATLDRLLHEQGDATISLPLSQPAPAPVPVPPAPGPNPGPPNPGPDAADLTLFRQTRVWAGEHHVGQGKAVAGDLKAWYAAKGF